MRTHFSFRQSVAIACLVVGLSAGSLWLDAQEKSPPTRPVIAPGPPSAAAPDYTLEIMNGKLSLAQPKVRATLSKRSTSGDITSVATLISVVDLLRDMHPEANIAMSPELANVKIADLKLRATSLDDELEALRVASGERFIWTRPGAMAAVDPSTGLSLARAPAQTALYSLVPNEAGKFAASRRTVEVFNLGPYLQRKGAGRDSSIKEIEQIILATLRQMKGEDSADDAPSYQFHSGANLLIVIGQPEALEVARKVLSALEGEVSGPVAFGGGGGGGGVGGGGGAGFARFMPFGRNVEPSKARQKIVDKLESIQFDAVLYDNLPLGEVIHHLIDEAKKRDPEKKGLNFLVNPNAPAQVVPGAPINPATGQPVESPPVEAVDIRGITIKIDPALTNVRLMDVLDAIVKVADRPIKYSITDYAVVFSLGEQNGPAEGAQSPGAPPGR
jgi:hypothetical protein